MMAKVAAGSLLDPLACEFAPSSDDEPVMSSSGDSEASLEGPKPEGALAEAVHLAVERIAVPVREETPLDECDMSTIERAVHQGHRVRNLAIIAHVDHGKTTIADRLLAKASMLRDQQVAKSCKMDTGALEIERGITIRASSTGLLYSKERLLLNLVDCPGHVDFNGEVAAALRITDGALLVVDCIEGVCVQTEMVLRQALVEGVRPVLFLNKLDRAFGELQLSPEQAYLRLVLTIEAVNSIVREYEPEWELCPSQNTVLFGSGLFGWGFTLADMAKARGLTCSSSKLWGDRYLHKGAFLKAPPSPDAERSFVSVVLAPLYRLHNIADHGEEHQLEAFAARHNLAAPAPQPRCKDMVRALLRSWLPCADAIVAVAAEQLPSPAQAQQARADTLAGSDPTMREIIGACDPEGPLVVFICKLAAASKESKQLVGLGRVFSGTARPGDAVLLIGEHGQTTKEKVDRVKMVMVDRSLELSCAPAGCLVALAGIQHTGTLVQQPDLAGMPVLSLAMRPVVSVAVRPCNARDSSKVVHALRELCRLDRSLRLDRDEELGEHSLAGAGELHLQSALHDLQELLPAGVGVQPGEPSVRCRETAGAGGQVCLAKSNNKHNRVYARAVPLDEGTQELLESGQLTEHTEEKARADLLATVGWDRQEARRKVLRITGSNMLVDCTEGLPMGEVIEHLAAAFDAVSGSGVLCGSAVAGVRIEINEGTRWHKERTHRGPNQMAEPARRAMLAALLSAEPRVREPVLEVTVLVPEAHAQKVCSVIKGRRGVINGYESDRLVTVNAMLPVDAAFGLAEQLRKESSGYASPQCCFSCWQEIPGDPLAEEGLAAEMVARTRARKKMPAAVPRMSDLADKL
eukprot:TRINITY_DN5621_c0_g1_i3.p1 TRINITY_DN5621_c0_g1~~TRINITY_DN5621_c0_g1_i3.p1  ORF type:complete len:862 (-),score=276.65 TRINITY_DN5621_c0_g1_i3:126-2711(-)